MTTNNQQVEELREKIKYLKTIHSLNDGIPFEVTEILADYQVDKIMQLFTHQLTLKDEQHAKELELARIETIKSTIEFISGYKDWEMVKTDILLSELTKQKEKLLNV